jgi:hypothetical protein
MFSNSLKFSSIGRSRHGLLGLPGAFGSADFALEISREASISAFDK